MSVIWRASDDLVLVNNFNLNQLNEKKDYNNFKDFSNQDLINLRRITYNVNYESCTSALICLLDLLVNAPSVNLTFIESVGPDDLFEPLKVNLENEQYLCGLERVSQKHEGEADDVEDSMEDVLDSGFESDYSVPECFLLVLLSLLPFLVLLLFLTFYAKILFLHH